MTTDDLRADIQHAARRANCFVYGWPYGPRYVMVLNEDADPEAIRGNLDPEEWKA